MAKVLRALGPSDTYVASRRSRAQALNQVRQATEAQPPVALRCPHRLDPRLQRSQGPYSQDGVPSGIMLVAQQTTPGRKDHICRKQP